MSRRMKWLWNHWKQLNILSGTQLTVKQEDFASPCNISNFDGIENGRSWLGSFNAQRHGKYYLTICQARKLELVAEIKRGTCDIATGSNWRSYHNRVTTWWKLWEIYLFGIFVQNDQFCGIVIFVLYVCVCMWSLWEIRIQISENLVMER